MGRENVFPGIEVSNEQTEKMATDLFGVDDFLLRHLRACHSIRMALQRWCFSIHRHCGRAGIALYEEESFSPASKTIKGWRF